MNLIRNVALAGLLPACGAWGLSAGPMAGAPPSADAQARIRFTYENPKLQPVKYVIVVREDGSGHYHSERGNAVEDAGTEFPALGQDRDIRVSQKTRTAIFAAARHSRYFARVCEGGGKHAAFQGEKTLEYSGPQGQGSCIYNWSNDVQIEKLTDIFAGISLTLEEGAKLKIEYEHSRLALDPELEFLEQAARDGNALEINNIAPLLRAIAADDRNLKRVQRRASGLLAVAGPD